MGTPTIVTGIAESEPERVPQADPRDIVLAGRKRLATGPSLTIDDMARPDALWPLAADGRLVEGEVVDVVGRDFLLVLRIDEIDRERQRVRAAVLDEHVGLARRR